MSDSAIPNNLILDSSLDLNPDLLEKLKVELKSTSEATQLKAIAQLEKWQAAAIAPLCEYLRDRQLSRRPANLAPTYLDGRAYQLIHQIGQDLASLTAADRELILELAQKLETSIALGILALPAALKVDLAPLQGLLVAQQFEQADLLTSKLMCQLASADAASRGWIYFTEIEQIAVLDLQTIDRLWAIYSEGKFGFAMQRRLWLSLGKNWEDFWRQIGWKADGRFTRFPGGFTWSITAPKGHLPLSNQIRGNKTIETIFNHPAWQ